MLKTISLQLDVGLLERLDAARGDVPRQRYVARRLEEALDRVLPLTATPLATTRARGDEARHA